MAERRVSVKFTAEIQGFKRAMEEAAQATQKTKKASEDSSKAADTYLGKMVESANKSRDAWDTAGASMLGIGTAATAGLGLAGKAAMDWESAWAGVTKTVDGTPAQMDALEESLRGLAKTLPATHEEIAGVAEAAGQLGVKREDVVGFTKTMIDLGNTTNLTADEAATSIAQISNVMGTMERDGSKGVERFGATLVALGNAGASTEAEILDMATRISGAGKLVGASESDVLALANAMASLGIESQLGGGVISRVMQRMYEDVKTGGEGLDNLAKVAGVSSKEFAAAFESDPVRAVDMMVKGLGRVKDEGGNVMQTMSDLGIKGTEETGVILRLAGAGDILTDSLKLGDSAWASNSALAAEAAKRYETTESKVKIAWNNIKDAAIDAGAVLLPIIAGVAEGAAGVAQAFGSLPDPVKGALSILGGVAGVATLGAGAFLTLTPKILDSVQAFDKLAPSGGKARGAISAAAGIAGKAAVAYTALATAAALAADAADGSRHKTSVEDFNNALIGTTKNSQAAQKAIDEAFKGVLSPDVWSGGTTSVNSFSDALDRVFHASWQDSATDFRDSVFGQNATSGINAAKDAIGNYDKALASMATSGNFEDAAAGFELAAKKAKDNGDEIETLLPLFPAYKDAILANKSANGETQVSQESLIDAMLKGGKATEGTADALSKVPGSATPAAETIEDVGTAAEQSAKQADTLVEKLLGLNNVNLSASDAQLGFDQAIADAGKNFANAAEGVDYLNEKTGEYNQTAADNLELLNGIASKGNQTAKAVYDQTGSYEKFRGSLEDSRQSLFDVAKAYYPTEQAAWAYVNSVMAIPPEMKTTVDITDDGTIEGVKGNLKLLHEAIQGTPDKTVIVKEPLSPEVIKGLEKLGYVVTHLPDGTIRVGETGTSATGQKIDNTAGKKRVATINAQAITGAAEAALNETARARSSVILQEIRQTVLPVGGDAPPKSIARPPKSTGGILRGYSDGGQLPSTGPGTEVTDGFLGIDMAGRPVARLDANEWIINGHSSNRYNRELAAINAGTFPKLPGYADGARHGREYSAQQLGYAPAYAASSAPQPMGDIYVQNPWTGEYLLAKAANVAAGAIAAADNQSQYTRTGRA